MKELYRPASVRFFPKDVEKSLGVRGRLVDMVVKPFSAFLKVDGRWLQFEFYFSTCTNWRPVELPRLPYFVWGSPEWHSCEAHARWSIGYNPCHYCCGLHRDPCKQEVSQLPDTWEFDYIAVDCVDDILAASDRYSLCWY